MDSLSATENAELVAGKLNEFVESEYNTKQSFSHGNRRKGFVKWDTKQIQCLYYYEHGSHFSKYQREDILKHFQSLDQSKPNFCQPLQRSTNNKKNMFESASVETLLKFVNIVYFYK